MQYITVISITLGLDTRNFLSLMLAKIRRGKEYILWNIAGTFMIIAIPLLGIFLHAILDFINTFICKLVATFTNMV